LIFATRLSVSQPFACLCQLLLRLLAIAVGRVQALINRQDRNVISYAYDSIGNLKGETWKTGLTTTNIQTFAHDADSNQTLASDSHGSYTMAYDALGRTTSVKKPNSVVLTYGFDAASQQALRQDSFGGVLTSA
jgi:YD repeat-containing protein